jgi:GTPase SAR1 family protein
MSPQILSFEWQQQSNALAELLQRALWLAEKRADFEATQILRARLTNLQTPALLVVVGEVKAGKSSFINALLREQVCDVAPGPCTTRIRELVWGNDRTVATLGTVWDRVTLPKDVLREVTIVDTPGTNSLVRDHQTITENYIPQSDLVIFVFSAANPHTKSAWELLKLIRKDWHRKIVFVLQQADRASARELQVNREYVRAYAIERQVAEPVIFTLSAKEELEGNPQSGYAEFRAFLQNAIVRGDVWRIKVEGAYETVRGVMKKILDQLHTEQHAIDAERAFYSELLGQVRAREAKASSLKQLMITKIAAVYDDLARSSEDEFTQGLAVAKLLRRLLPFHRDATNETWITGLKVRFQQSARKEIAAQARRVSSELAQEVESMIHDLRDSILRRQETFKERASLPQSATNLKFLDQLQSRLDRIQLGEGPIVSSHVDDTADVSRFAIAGGGLAIIGVILAAVSQNTWLRLAGGTFAVLGVLLIGAGLLWRRAEMLRTFREKLGVSRQEFHARLEAEFEQVFDGLFAELREALTDAVFRLDLQAFHLKPAAQETFALGEAAGDQLLQFQRTLAPAPAQPAVTPIVATGTAAA